MDKQPKPSGAPGVRPATGAPKGLDELNMAILNRMGGLAGVLRVCESIACRVEFVHRFDKISESLAFEKYRIEPT